jgi:hypothetical protein
VFSTGMGQGDRDPVATGWTSSTSAGGPVSGHYRRSSSRDRAAGEATPQTTLKACSKVSAASQQWSLGSVQARAQETARSCPW